MLELRKIARDIISEKTKGKWGTYKPQCTIWFAQMDDKAFYT